MSTAEDSKIGPSHGAAGPAALFVSVVLPVRNEALFIGATLAQLLDQDYPQDRFEVLVVDGVSDDETPAIVAAVAARAPNVRLLSNPKKFSSAARNVGAQAARGELILYIDGHCEIPSRCMLTDVVDAFQRSGAECLARPQPLEVSGATPLQCAIAAARSSWLGHHPESFIYSSSEQFVPALSVAVAYRRVVFDRVGEFDETFDACEDVEFNHRVDEAEMRCFFTPRAAVRYFPRDSLRGLFWQMARYGRGRVRLLKKHPKTFSYGMIPPAALVAGTVLGLPLCFAGKSAAMVYAAALVLYLAVVAAGSLSVALRLMNLRLLAWLPLVFATVHFGAGIGILQELLEHFFGLSPAL